MFAELDGFRTNYQGNPIMRYRRSFFEIAIRFIYYAPRIVLFV